MSIRKKRCIVDFDEPKEFSVDHPFIYQLYHKTTVTSPPSSPTSTDEATTILPLFMGSHHVAVSDAVTTPTADSSTNRISDEL